MNLFASWWNCLFFVGFIVYLTIRGVYAQRTKHVEKVHKRIDRTERVLLVLVIAGSTLLPVLYLFTPLLSFADYDWPAFVPACGVVVMIFALWLFYRSHADLGQFWSVSLEVSKDHQLVTAGTYKRIRHPMYAAIWLWSLAQAMLLSNWLAGLSSLILFGVMYFVRTPREEQMMREFFGQQYVDYMSRTGRLFPRLKL